MEGLHRTIHEGSSRCGWADTFPTPKGSHPSYLPRCERCYIVNKIKLISYRYGSATTKRHTKPDFLLRSQEAAEKGSLLHVSAVHPILKSC